MSNYDFLQSLLTTIPEDVRNISLWGYVILIVISLVTSLLISHLYVKFYDANSTGSRIHRSFPLMGPAVTTIFLTVQFSLPLSLGLLGALSIVRFRTPIKEPEEIGFILLLIACSIAIATYNVAFTALLYVIMFVALSVLKFLPSFNSSASSAVILNISLRDAGVSTVKEFEKVLKFLSQNQIKHTVSSVHVDGEKVNASILLKKVNKDPFDTINSMSQQFDNIVIDYYRR